MPETKEERIARFKQFIQIGTEGLKELGELDETPGPTERHRAEEEATSLFDKLSSAEVLEMYYNDEPKWQEMMDNVQSAGERKLAKLNRP